MGGAWDGGWVEVSMWPEVGVCKFGVNNEEVTCFGHQDIRASGHLDAKKRLDDGM